MPPLTDSRGDWSPYGDKIVFTTQTAPNRQPALWIVRANGRRLHRVHIHPDCGGLSSNPQALACFEPSWSPNGHRIVFVRTNPGGGFDIYTVGVGGRGLVRVTRSGRALEPDWGPDRPNPFLGHRSQTLVGRVCATLVPHRPQRSSRAPSWTRSPRLVAGFLLSGRRDLNSRPLPPKRIASLASRVDAVSHQHRVSRHP